MAPPAKLKAPPKTRVVKVKAPPKPKTPTKTRVVKVKAPPKARVVKVKAAPKPKAAPAKLVSLDVAKKSKATFMANFNKLKKLGYQGMD